MEIRLLGPVELWGAGRELPLVGPRQRCVLAVLAVAVGRPVGMDQLVAQVWGERLPDGVRSVVYTHVSRLRRVLEHAGAGRGPEVLRRAGGGYVLDIDPDLVDLHRFRGLVASARAEDGGGDERVVELLDEAAGLWRGVPLAGLDGDWVERTREGLERERLTILTDAFAARLRIGRHASVIGPASEVLTEYPLSESLAGVLMLALYRCERPAEALAVYTDFRQRLVAEIGDEPGMRLRRLHEQILRRDPALNGEAGAVADEPPPTAARRANEPVPAQLPADLASFVGRTEALKALDELLPPANPSPVPVAISVIVGAAGVGKTTLAVHWAHRVAHHFPDGQLHVNLRGFYPADRALSPVEALRRLLHALGVAAERVPVDLDTQAALYRSLVADKRMLVVLDNARDAEQVRPLLPGSSTVAVVVTSRDQLTPLVVSEGARPLLLDLLSTQEGRELLEGRLGGERVAAHPEATDAIIAACARLPLALAIAAARAQQSGFALPAVAAELADAGQRLDALDAGDPAVQIRSVLSWSYDALSTPTARLFLLLGLHPGPDISATTAASLAGRPAAQVRPLLTELTRASLITEHTLGRYTWHDLLRAYATELAAQDPEPEQHAALTRLLDHYLRTAAQAAGVVYPQERKVLPENPYPETATPDLTEPASAARWLDAELANLLACAARAADQRWWQYPADLSRILREHLFIHGRYQEAEALHHQALGIAHTSNDPQGQLDARLALGQVYRVQGSYGQSADHYQQALELARTSRNRHAEFDALYGLGQIHRLKGDCEPAVDQFRQALDIARANGDRHGELSVLHGLGQVDRAQGRFPQAASHYEQALDIARVIGDRMGELNSLNSLGWIQQTKGRYEEAANLHRQALDLAHDLGSHLGELNALRGLGMVHRIQGKYPESADCYQRALEITRATANRQGELYALYGLGHVYREQRRYGAAADSYQRALNVAHELGDRNGQLQALLGLARLHHASGDLEAALSQHHRARRLAIHLGQSDDEARAHDGLAHTYQALNQHGLARYHWSQVLVILTRLGIDHTDDPQTTTSAVRRHLADLDQPSHDQP